MPSQQQTRINIVAGDCPFCFKRERSFLTSILSSSKPSLSQIHVILTATHNILVRQYSTFHHIKGSSNIQSSVKLEAGRSAANSSRIQLMDPNLAELTGAKTSKSSPQPPAQDCFRKVKISRVLEPLFPSNGGSGVGFGEGEGVDEGDSEEGCGVEVPP